MFSEACVKNSVHGGWVCIPACTGADTPHCPVHAGIHTPWQTPPRQTTSLGRHPPGRHPPGRHPPGRHPPGKHPPPSQIHTPSGQTPPSLVSPPGRPLQRTVRILLECILVQRWRCCCVSHIIYS